MAAENDRNEASAKLVHEARHKAALASEPFVITFAVEALKSAILVNGGTAGALLAFVGQKGIQTQPGLGEAFYWFAGGLLAGAIATAFAYLAQFCYANTNRCYINNWEYPYTQDTSAFKWWLWVAYGFHLASLLSISTSFGAAVRGFWVSARALPF
jgi:hypothetical protein